jgi:spore germination cell wall hydrolase CwlJ-like protein
MSIGAEALLMLILQKTDIQVDAEPQEVYCLSLNVYQEARGEPAEGQVAVANVVKNRVESRHYPNTYCKVVKQRYGRVCQFSWYCDGLRDHPIFRSKYSVDAEAFKAAVGIALQVLAGNIEDNTHGALYFHADYVNPRWSRIKHKTIRYGNHIFYR